MCSNSHGLFFLVDLELSPFIQLQERCWAVPWSVRCCLYDFLCCGNCYLPKKKSTFLSYLATILFYLHYTPPPTNIHFQYVHVSSSPFFSHDLILNFLWWCFSIKILNRNIPAVYIILSGYAWKYGKCSIDLIKSQNKHLLYKI